MVYTKPELNQIGAAESLVLGGPIGSGDFDQNGQPTLPLVAAESEFEE